MLHFIFDRYWQICLLRESPENTPYSIIRLFVSGLILVLILVLEWSFSHYNNADLGTNIILASGLLFSYFFYSYAILFLKNHVPRLVQTVTALYYTSIIIHLFVAPLVYVAPYLSQAHLMSPLLLIIAITYLCVSLGLSIWQFIIVAHIYKNALNVSGVQSAMAAIGLMAVNILTLSFLQ